MEIIVLVQLYKNNITLKLYNVEIWMIVGVIYFYKDINNITARINPNIVQLVILSPKTLGDGNL